MWKRVTLLVCISAVIEVGNGQVNFSLHKPDHGGYHHHHHDPYYHLIYGGGLISYLTFLAIKIKVVFILGTIFTFMLFAGKLYAIVKYAEYMKQEPKQQKHTEKVYLQDPHHSFDSGPYMSSFGGSGPDFGGGSGGFGGGGGHDFGTFGGGPSFSEGVDKLPPGAEVEGANRGPPYMGGGDATSYFPTGGPDSLPPSGGGGSGGYNGNGGQGYGGGGYGRNIDETGGLMETLRYFMNLIRSLNTTETVFDSMRLKTEDCKRKFVCETDFNARYSPFLNHSLELFRDDLYDSYRTNRTVQALRDCRNYYPDCHG